MALAVRKIERTDDDAMHRRFQIACALELPVVGGVHHAQGRRFDGLRLIGAAAQLLDLVEVQRYSVAPEMVIGSSS